MSASMFQTAMSYVGEVLLHWTAKPDLTFGAAAQRQHRCIADDRGAIILGLSLSARFAFAAAVVLCNGMALLGGWVVTHIENGLLQNAAASDSSYVQSLLSPVVPLIAKPEGRARQIETEADQYLLPTHLWSGLKSIAIWLPDGTIDFSTDSNLEGRKFVMPREAQQAFGGNIETTLSDRRSRLLLPATASTETERKVYAPLREKNGERVVAVVELVTNANAFSAQLDAIRKRTWIVVGVATLIMIGVLFGIVQNGSRTIAKQRLEIERRLDEEIRLGQVNKALWSRLQDANRRGIELGEEQLRRIGSDLENGPVQLLALALLRMYELEPVAEQKKSGSPRSLSELVDVISRATTGAMRELREISSGLSLPELKSLSSQEAIERAIQDHEDTTETLVERNISSLPNLTLPVTICMYRVVQEGLLNAYCHAGGRGQAVTCYQEDDYVIVAVSDSGPGFCAQDVLEPSSSLGLRWLRQRVESIDGTLTITSTELSGTQLSARIPHGAAAPNPNVVT